MKRNKKIKQLIRKCIEGSFINGKLNDKKALGFVQTFKKLPSYQAIAYLREFKKQLERRLLETTLLIESATSLSKQELLAIRKKLEREFRVQSSEFRINKTLLGGIKVQVGDFVFDDSVNLRIKEIKEVIASS